MDLFRLHSRLLLAQVDTHFIDSHHFNHSYDDVLISQYVSTYQSHKLESGSTND